MECLLRKIHFGPFSRSISLNTNSYSPQLIEKLDSKWLSLATTSIPGQTPKAFWTVLFLHLYERAQLSKKLRLRKRPAFNNTVNFL